MDNMVNGGILRVVHQNVQGLVSKLSMVEILIELVSPTILCMSEHFLREVELNSFCLPEYIVASGYCRSDMAKGGVCVLVKDNLIHQEVDVKRFCTEGYCELAAIKFDLENVSYLLIAVYRPPHQTVESVDAFLESLSVCLEHFTKINTRIIIMGDFNIDYSIHDSSSKKLSEMMLSFGLHATVYSYTREFKGSKSLIDNVFCNISPQTLNSEVLVSGISDHHAQVTDIRLVTPLHCELPRFRFKRSFSEDNIRIFKTFLRKEHWDQVFTAESMNEKADFFNSILNYYFELSFPCNKSKIQPKRFFTKIKLDKSLLLMRDHLLNMFYSTKDLEKSDPLKVSYLHLKKQYRLAVRTAKAKNILSHLNTSSCKSRAVWDIVNETIPKKKTKYFKSFELLTNNGDLLTNPEEIANTFNSFFTSVSRELVNDPAAINHSFLVPSSCSSIFLHSTNEEEVLEIIMSLKNSNSAGSDCVSSRVLKEVGEYLVRPLSDLVNASFAEGRFPKALKSAVVNPLYKKGSVFDTNNYRPISITSTFSKVFEKLFLNRLHPFLVNNHLLYKKQFGFQKDISTIDAMFSFISNVSKALDDHKHVFGFFFDLSKAFDMVNHGLLLKKLEHFGIRGNALSWISSFLEGRTQTVQIPYLDANRCISSQKSHEIAVTCGVPQGSVLGPILFLLFVNDIHSSVSNVDLCLFADDTSLNISNASRSDLEIESFIQCSALLQWLVDNNLTVNTEKTHFIEFKLGNSVAYPSSVFVGDNEIDSCLKTNFLGLIIDNHLDFSEHIDNLSRKLNSSIFILRRLAKFANTDVLLSAYFGSFYPQISYAVAIWGAETTKTKAIFRLQKRAIRLVFGMKKGDSCRGIFIVNNLLTFSCLYIFQCLSFFIKNKHLFSFRNIRHYNLRYASSALTIPHHNTASFEKHSYFTIIKLFNSLPLYIKSESDVKRFRGRLRSFLVAKEYYSVQEYLTDNVNF